ncbi:hypothetical protein [Halalkalibacter oceani]|uniref:hypothetical protein n=1 Tax=Halalkalibacter oceani TaxID=1653776 RepID=UPI00339840BD
MSNLNMNDKVYVKNLCAWDIYFRRIERAGDIKIPSKGRIPIERSEIQSQIYDGNVFFVGVDGQGSKAKVYIEDKDTRVLVGFEEENSTKKQEVLDEKEMSRILELKTDKSFKDNLNKHVTLQNEKFAIMEHARKSKFKDYEKIRILEEHTGYKFEEPKIKTK